MVWIWLLSVAVSFAILYLIYRKRQEEEQGLFVKLLGYSFLGAFTFSLNEWKLPAGFLICLFLLGRTQRNKSVKQWAALFGLLLFFMQFVTPAIENYWFERPRTAAVQFDNLYTQDFLKQWNMLEENRKVNTGLRLENFEIVYKSDGQIEQLKFDMVEQSGEGFIYHEAELNKNHHQLIMKRHRIEGPWYQYEHSIPVYRFFEKLNEFDLKKLKPMEAYPYYKLFARDGVYISYAIKDVEKYVIEGEQVLELKNDQLPVTGYWLQACGTQLVHEQANFGCDNRTDFLFDAIYGQVQAQ